jgi:hypothetical protein|tara:strand:+ start:626 stop:901 length:276 start_codon:yes stop_codon:yes gene_type:complete
MKYCTATHSGKGFFTHADREAAHLSGHPGNVWCVGDSNSDWITRVGGTEKTLEQAQTILDSAISDAQVDWDNLTAEIKRYLDRPVTYSLPT